MSVDGLLDAMRKVMGGAARLSDIAAEAQARREMRRETPMFFELTEAARARRLKEKRALLAEKRERYVAGTLGLVTMTDSLHGDLREPSYRMGPGIGEQLRTWYDMTPEERAAQEEERRAAVAADDLARGPVIELPDQDPDQPVLCLVITDEMYDASTVHGVFPTLEQAQAYVAAEWARWETLPTRDREARRGVLAAVIETWRGREQVATWDWSNVDGVIEWSESTAWTR
ncbi:hypothetical protein EOG37_01280 [Clavibacter michiganensis subsp. michiganensis]|uniref:hypothetical protein n=1 Tax=Clavibacter michiganensis TaxID=28447 RepID=UPI001C650FA1|nr:hypothetical protein [Clavibacter michiganensis]MBW8025312.1 hypothetical protein [Clavibacter michiganensis subsp. michiganensis]